MKCQRCDEKELEKILSNQRAHALSFRVLAENQEEIEFLGLLHLSLKDGEQYPANPGDTKTYSFKLDDKDYVFSVIALRYVH